MAKPYHRKREMPVGNFQFMDQEVKWEITLAL